MEKDPTEPREIKPGKYIIRARFKDRRGQEIVQDVKRIELANPASLDQIEYQAIDETAGLGLHNFGMDVYVDRYPNGHPVELSIEDGSGLIVHKFIQAFNGSGYPVKSK